MSIAIPAAGAFINALIIAIRSRRVTGSVIALVFFGLMCAAVAAVAFLGLDWNLLGPTLLILLGATILLGIFNRR